MKQRVHTFKYSSKLLQRPWRITAFRDEAALDELVRGICAKGSWRPGEQVLNLPMATPPVDPAHPGPELTVDRSRFAAGDLIVAATRPPIDDTRVGEKKRVLRGYTDLEYLCFEVWKQYLATCSRSMIELTPAVRAGLPQDAREMALMEFYQYKHCRTVRANDTLGSGWESCRGGNWTACFLLRVDSLWKDGPGLVWAFGMDSVATLAWCHRLVTTETDLLQHRGFTMARMDYAEPPDHYIDLDWTTETALDVVLQTPGPQVVMPEEQQATRKSAKRVQRKDTKSGGASKGKDKSKGKPKQGDKPRKKDS